MNIHTPFFKTVSGAVLLAFTMLVLEPAAVAAQVIQQEYQAGQAEAARQRASALERAQHGLRTALDKLQRGDETGEAELDVLQAELPDLDAAALADFDAVKARLLAKNLPEDLLQRHEQAVADYRREMQTLQDNLAEVKKGKDKAARQAAAGRASEHLKKNIGGRKHQPFDPAHLPYKSLQPPENNLPKTTEEAFRSAGLYNTPLIKLAGLGDFKFDTLAGASDPAYLAETPEITISPAIRAKAEELEYQPVEIFSFVRDNVHWLPTWGAMQDADLTLSSLQGNSADISALLIALLRASGIPARYVHGTVDVPVEKFMNWAGNFSDANAAGIHAASGGIPVTPVVSGGKTVRYRIEHIWVEAAVDFYPSRGVKNNQADAWATLDASFKQYEYLQGIDVDAVASLDGETLLTQFNQSGTQNEAEGWLTGFDSTIISNAQNARRAALEQYIATNFTNPTVGDIIGGQRILKENRAVLPTSLPNRIHVVGARYAEMPDALRHRVSFDFNSAMDNTLGGGSEQVSYPMAALNNRKVTLSFKPATANDEAALASFLPDGEITDLSQLPQSIPAYLIRMVAELKVDGATVLSGKPLSLGADQDFNFTVYTPGFGTRTHPSPVVAGSYLSVAVVGGSFSEVILKNLKNSLETRKAAWEAGDVSGFNRENFLGDMFYAGTLGYFAQYYGMTTLQARTAGVAFRLMPSVGTYGSVPDVDYLLGFPRSVSPGGIEMDMDRVTSVFTVKNGEQNKRFGFTFAAGMLSSALEHTVPEQMFVREGDNSEAISAVKALYMANAQHMPIYHITKDNAATVMPKLRLNEIAIDEIQSALAVGREVITHQAELSVPGWTGAGYIIYDPVTGDGAFKIGGGLNGAIFGFVLGLALMVAISLIAIAASPAAPAIFAAALVTPSTAGIIGGIAATFIGSMLALLELTTLNPREGTKVNPAFYAWLGIGGALGLLLAAFVAGGVVMAIIALIFTIFTAQPGEFNYDD